MSYFPDGQRMISGSWDRTTRQWDVKAGKEIEEARGVSYTTDADDDFKICICDTPPDILAQASVILHAKRQTYSVSPLSIDSANSFTSLARIQFLFITSIIQPRNPIDVSATLPLPSSLSAQSQLDSIISKLALHLPLSASDDYSVRIWDLETINKSETHSGTTTESILLPCPPMDNILPVLSRGGMQKFTRGTWKHSSIRAMIMSVCSIICNAAIEFDGE
ncbi:hypothetical protein P692DRAFT_20880106 [Suillus brevipes Sb2]|nr:hypothetical protein P692DRAFT_20880106 [Suillus brevipes Sb2]